jgi:sulfite reductase beta subunit-like hemoprotein
MGRQSAVGISLNRQIPEADLLRVAVAVIDLFHDHGNRQDRQHARLRFLLQDLGETAFRERFDACFAAVRTDVPELTVLPSSSTTTPPCFPEASPRPEFDFWRQRAVHPTANPETWSVELLLPHGNATPGQLRAIADLAAEFADDRVRLSTRQTVWLRQIHVSALPYLHRRLQSLPDDWSGKSFRGLIPHCVGTGVCPLGFLDSPTLAEAIGEELDSAFAHQPDLQAKALTEVLDGIRISGCTNSCASHLTATLGLQGLRLRLSDGSAVTACQAFHGVPESILGQPDPDPILLSEVPGWVRDWLCRRLGAES